MQPHWEFELQATRPKGVMGRNQRNFLSLLCVGSNVLFGGTALAEDSVESVPAGEDAAIADVMNSIARGYALRSQTVKRMAHAKHHGCVRGTFTIGDVPRDLKLGIFARPFGTTFRTFARFSNGSSAEQHDEVPDARGFAIKLFGVSGDKLLKDEHSTQDFLMHNAPIFLVRDVASVTKFMGISADPGTASMLKAIREIAKDRPSEVLHELNSGLRIVLQSVGNPLEIPYYSALPASVGSRPVKFGVRPCASNGRTITVNRVSANFLRSAMKDKLTSKEACFEFLVQRRTDPSTMPIEDPTIEWSAAKAPYVHVATIRFPIQSFDSEKQMAFCENLSFTSWHSLPEHRPLGGINRLRKVAYEFSSKVRHGMNAALRVEPTGAETFE